MPYFQFGISLDVTCVTVFHKLSVSCRGPFAPIFVAKVGGPGYSAPFILCVETQRRRHQKSKTGVSVAPQKGLIYPKFKKKKKNYGLYFV